MHSIRIPEEMDTNLVLTDKLKAARLRKCNMIFDAFNPDNKDTIHLREWELDSYLNYIHHDSANSLKMFFQAFRNQTNKNTMNRKYFIVNILTALDKNKFNLHILFQQDPDIIELEKKMKIPLPTTHTSNMCEQVKERINSGVSVDGTIIESTQRTELPLQRQTEKVLAINNSKDRSRSPIPSNRRIKSIEERDNSVLISHESQRDNKKKLQDYLKRHFETDLIDPHSQREISSSVIVNNVEESQLITSSPLPHKKVDTTPKRLPPPENHRSKSIPSTAEIELGKCTFEPKLYQPMKTVVRNEIQPKIYDYMLKNKILSGLKLSDLEGDTSFTRKQQKTGPSPHKNRNSESFVSLSGRSLPRNPSMEALTNVSLINFGYADAYQRKIEYAQQHLIPDYVELKTRRKSLEKQNPKLKSLSAVRTNSSKTGFAAKPPVVKEVHILLENLTEKPINKTPPPKSIPEHIEKMHQQNPLKINDESLEIRKKYYAYLRNEGGKRSNSSLRTTQTLDRSNSRLSTHESNKAENSFHGGTYLSVPSFLYDPIQQKNNQNQGKKGQRDTNQFQNEKSSLGIQRQNSSSVLYNKNINDSGLLKQNMESKKSSKSKSKFDMPFKRSPNYHIKAEGPNRKGEEQQQISVDKENNYHFSFTEKDISQTHLG